jgi:hypothetical protein
MRPRVLAHLLGLCNLVAGALLSWRPELLLAGVDGVHTAAARLLGASAAVFLVGVAAGAWWLPAAARRPYLWIFGVTVKAVAALVWATAAIATGASSAWTGAAFDGALALVIAAGLSLRADEK